MNFYRCRYLFFQSASDSSCKKKPLKQKEIMMFVSLDRRLLYGLTIPSTLIVIGGLIWYHKRRKSPNNNICSNLFITR